MNKVLELKGYKSLRAFNGFHTLLLGMKMLPLYISESYEAFYNRFSELDDSSKEAMLREAALFVDLEKEQIEAMMSFCYDKNGIPYEPSNMKNLKPNELIEIIISVCMEISTINIDLISESEKKKLQHFTVDLKKSFVRNPTASLEEMINCAFYESAHIGIGSLNIGL